MLAKRIIPCLDVRDGKVVKGVNFEGIKEVGDPVECAYEYNLQGADEIVFYDITASHEGRGVMLDVVRETAKKVFVPLTVGGGIKTVDDIRDTLRAGADKVSVNSQAVQNPQLIKDGADIFGCQCICVGVDAKKVGDNKWTVYINGGRVDMRMDLIDWVKKCEQLGAGEICLNSIDTDGVRGGFDLPMLKAVCSAVKIPVIASGGAGKLSDFADAFLETDCSAALAASLFHFKELTVGQVKDDCIGKRRVKTGLSARANTFTTPAFSPIFMMPSQRASTPVSPREISKAFLEESKVESTIFWKMVVSPIANPMSAKMNAITKNAIQM